MFQHRFMLVSVDCFRQTLVLLSLFESILLIHFFVDYLQHTNPGFCLFFLSNVIKFS